MLHQASFSHESKQSLYFVNSSLNRIEHTENTAVTVNPIKSFQTELDMSSNNIYLADDNAPAHMNTSNVGTTELPTSFTKSDCVDKLRNVDSEYNTTSQFPNFAFDERQPSPQLINGSDLEICRTSHCQPTRDDANILSLSTGQQPDLPIYGAAVGDSMTETRTTLSLCSPENARHVMRDIAVDRGTSSKEKIPIVPDSSVVIEELVKFKTSLVNEMKFHKHALETIADQLKMIAVKDIQDIPEGQGLSFDVKGQTKEMVAYQDDKGILEESFILHFSSLEEKHVCNPLHEEQNAEKQEISIKSDCFTEPSRFALDKTGDMENPAEDGEKVKEPAIVSLDKMEGFKTLLENAEKYRKSDILSVDCMEDFKCSMEDGEKDREYAIVCEYHQKPILTVPTNKESYNGHDSDAFHVADCMDVRLESSSSRTHFLHYNPVETAMRLPISVNNDSTVELLGCGADSEDCLASHDIHAGESSGVASDEIHSVETSALKGQNSNNNSEYPNVGTIKKDGSDKTLCTVDDNFQMQENPSLASEKVHPAAVAGSSIAAIINPSLSNVDFTADDLVSKGCSDPRTDSFEMQKLEKMQDSFTRNPYIDQKESTVSAVENKSTLDSESSPVLSHTLQESDKICYLIENDSIDPEMKIYDTSKKSAKDNIPACPSVNINAALNGESLFRDTKSGCSTLQMFQEKTEESIVASEQKLTVDQKVSSVTCSTKEGNGTCEMSEKLVFDSTEIYSAASQKSVGNNVSVPAFVEIDTKRNVRQRSDLSFGFTGHSVSSVHSGQELLESFPDSSDEINGYSDMAESGRYTYSGPVSLSGPISYSGPIPFSGSISIRSDSSTTSTRSFAFPILASEWNSSPVKMAQADPRYHRKKRGWHFPCFCGGASATS